MPTAPGSRDEPLKEREPPEPIRELAHGACAEQEVVAAVGAKELDGVGDDREHLGEEVVASPASLPPAIASEAIEQEATEHIEGLVRHA